MSIFYEIEFAKYILPYQNSFACTSSMAIRISRLLKNTISGKAPSGIMSKGDC